MERKKEFSEFSIQAYGQIEKFNEVLSKVRCRIFYKGLNRNGTYITDEFAEKLLATCPYTPVKGIYDDLNEDYTDHGTKREQGRIYGIVPENPNMNWEKHLDEDGIERIYACVDVFLFTGLYKEASEILSKPQSMELYIPSIKGNFKFIEGKKAYVYEDGCFLGLQVLGDDVTPCFEGAAFYSFYDTLKTVIEKIEKYNLSLNNDKKGGKIMPFNFKLSDNEKSEMIFELLNPLFNEQGNWQLQYNICDVYDEYALVRNLEEHCFERVYYSKDDITDTVSLGKREICFIVDVTEDEKKTLDTIQKLNNGNFVNAEQIYEENKNLEEKVSEFEQQIIMKEQTISDLKEEKDSLFEQLENKKEDLSSKEQAYMLLEEEKEALKEYKLNNELKQKQNIIEKYTNCLSEEIIAEYTKNIDQYDVNDLQKELAYTLVENQPSIFSNLGVNIIPNQIVSHTGGIESILEKYRK